MSLPADLWDQYETRDEEIKEKLERGEWSDLTEGEKQAIWVTLQICGPYDLSYLVDYFRERESDPDEDGFKCQYLQTWKEF